MDIGQLANAATFICGHPKSGTSLIRALLDSHPELIVYPEETQFFRRVLPQISKLNYKAAAGEAEELLLHIFRWEVKNPDAMQVGYGDRDYSEFSFAKIRQEFRRVASILPQEHASLLAAAMLAFGAESGQLTANSKRWVEKTPYNETFAEEIFSRWPDARCIHLTRDPRDNYASYRRKHPDWSPPVFAYSWRKSARISRSNEKRFGQHQYLVLRYEDLVHELEGTLETLRGFLQIEDHSTLRIPSRAGRAWEGNSMFGDSFQGVSQKPVGRWKDELDPAVVNKLEVLLHSEMKNENYVISEVLALKDRLWRARFRFTWWAKEAIKSRTAS